MNGIRRTKPMTTQQINVLIDNMNSMYILEEEDGELLMVKNPNFKKQTQPNLLAHLRVDM